LIPFLLVSGLAHLCADRRLVFLTVSFQKRAWLRPLSGKNRRTGKQTAAPPRIFATSDMHFCLSGYFFSLGNSSYIFGNSIGEWKYSGIRPMS
jgi:hypothetical protein